MKELQNRIEKIKQESSYVNGVYSSLIEKLKQIKNSVLTNTSVEDLKVATILEKVRDYNKRVEFILSAALNTEFD